MICKIVQSKVKMAGIHSQADRDEANQIIDAARAVFNKQNLQVTSLLA